MGATTQIGFQMRIAKGEYRSAVEIDVLILCGGYGSRLQPLIKDRPKGMALIGGRPFLDILVDDLLRQGFQSIIFCVGYLKEQIIEHYKLRKDANFQFSEENTPLGTGGAVKNALTLVKSNVILVINGDSICKVNFSDLIHFHYQQMSSATFVLSNPHDRYDGGTVCIDGSNKIHYFLEKKSNQSSFKSLINAGIYLLDLERFSLSEENSPFSLEHNIFPNIVCECPCYGFVVDSDLIDIGTPERYLKAMLG